MTMPKMNEIDGRGKMKKRLKMIPRNLGKYERKVEVGKKTV